MNSFQPICKIIEDLAILDEHAKKRREATPIHGTRDSYDSSSAGGLT